MNYQDIDFLLKYIDSGLPECVDSVNLTCIDLTYSDINGDGSVNGDDARILTKLITRLNYYILQGSAVEYKTTSMSNVIETLDLNLDGELSSFDTDIMSKFAENTFDINDDGRTNPYDVALIVNIVEGYERVCGGSPINNSILEGISSTTANSFLKYDGRGNYNWHFVNGENEDKGIVISQEGTVGISNSNPFYDLDVSGIASVSKMINIPSCGGRDVAGLKIGDDSYIFDDSCPSPTMGPESQSNGMQNLRTLHIESDDDIQIKSGDQDSSNKGIYITREDKVGIGTDTPDRTLHVSGDIKSYEGIQIGYTYGRPCNAENLGMIEVQKYTQCGHDITVHNKLVVCMQSNNNAFGWETLIEHSWVLDGPVPNGYTQHTT
jgi:hypothetical protein